MKRILTILLFGLLTAFAFAQSDDDLFGGDDSFFSDDDLFGDDGIEEVTDVKAKTDLSKGVIFDTGSIKIGGNFNTGISTLTTLYADDGNDFGTYLKDATFTPSASAYLTVDARPSQTLRMYSKFGIAYPYKLQALSTARTEKRSRGEYESYNTTVTTSVSDWLDVKELFRRKQF